jgi:hypothetical protein
MLEKVLNDENESSYELVPTGETNTDMQDILKKRLVAALGQRLVQIMDQNHEKELNLQTFAEQLSSEVLVVLEKLEQDLNTIHSQVNVSPPTDPNNFNQYAWR